MLVCPIILFIDNPSEPMRQLNISYTSSFNCKHPRVGHRYQGGYKALLSDANDYPLEVSGHIHLNPIRVRVFSWKTVKRETGCASKE
jgi:hypothetical protein